MIHYKSIIWPPTVNTFHKTLLFRHLLVTDNNSWCMICCCCGWVTRVASSGLCLVSVWSCHPTLQLLMRSALLEKHICNKKNGNDPQNLLLWTFSLWKVAFQLINNELIEAKNWIRIVFRRHIIPIYFSLITFSTQAQIIGPFCWLDHICNVARAMSVKLYLREEMRLGHHIKNKGRWSRSLLTAWNEMEMVEILSLFLVGENTGIIIIV